MTSLIERDDGRFEIRESAHTPKGPRSRTLAIFRTLSADVLENAERRARRPFDLERIRRKAVELGVPYTGPSGLTETRAVLARLGEEDGGLPKTFVAALRELTFSSEADMPDTIPPMLDWIGKDDAARGRAVRDLLRLGDTIMRSRGARRTRELRYPAINDL